MKYRHSFIALSLITIGLAGNAYAHHSNAPHYDLAVEISMDAVVREWKFVNPHAYVYFDVTDEDGQAVTWRCETRSSNGLRPLGFSKETFVAGQRLTISGNPARREDNACYMTSFMYADGTLVNKGTSIPADKITGPPFIAELTTNEEARPKLLANGQPNISGYWIRPTGPRLDPQLDLTEAGLAEQAGYEQIYDDPAFRCEIVSILWLGSRYRHINSITQEDDKVTLLFGYLDYVRTIHLDQSEHPENIVPSSGGHSIGTWEDNVLVVDTIGFTEGLLHTMNGAPNSNQLHTTERYWYDEESKNLKRSYIAEDPVYLSSPFIGEDSHTISTRPYTPYNCTELSGENNKRPEDGS